MLDTINLADGNCFDWGDEPEQFRHIVDVNRARKLVRNADSVSVWVPSLGFVLVQKAGITAAIIQIEDPDLHVACIFNGLDLQIIGACFNDQDED